MSSNVHEPPRRPRLLAQNRKLRHLRGLSLRNLSFAAPSRGGMPLRSADDGDIPSSSRAGKNKLAALQESSSDVTGLHPSRSSENLPRLDVSKLRRPSVVGGSHHHQRAESDVPPTARPQAVQRRASLSLAQTTPVSRQKKLEDLADAAVGDVFFSLHDPLRPDEPVYISEIGERSANFDFRHFNLATCDASAARSCKVLIRIWTRRPKQDSWTYLLEELIDLRSLRFIATTLDRDYRPNALIFHLEDGVYSLDFPDRISEPRRAPPITTSSYNALMKLSNLESSLGDAEETLRAVKQQINDIIDSEPADGADAADEGVVLAHRYLSAQRRLNKQTEKRRDELRESLRARREAIAAGRELQRQREEDMDSSREELQASRRLLADTEQQIRGQRRRICADLNTIFPITPIPQAPPLSFQICGLALPNSVYDAAVARTIGEDALSAAIGLVALLARHLQFYLAHPLPYEVTHLGSRSYIRDDISHLADGKAVGVGGGAGVEGGRREFPLFLPRGGSTTGQWRFEYAWFLLNKDVEALCASQGLRVVDIRHSLPNLKYLLYVCSAGSDEVPERKSGGVRGLWAARLRGRVSGLGAAGNGGLVDDAPGSTPGSSRPGSADSEAHAQRGDVLRSAAMGGALPEPHQQQQQQQQQTTPVKGWSAMDGRGDVAMPDFSLPFGDTGTKFTLRTKGLRENVAG